MTMMITPATVSATPAGETGSDAESGSGSAFATVLADASPARATEQAGSEESTPVRSGADRREHSKREPEPVPAAVLQALAQLLPAPLVPIAPVPTGQTAPASAGATVVEMASATATTSSAPAIPATPAAVVPSSSAEPDSASPAGPLVPTPGATTAAALVTSSASIEIGPSISATSPPAAGAGPEAAKHLAAPNASTPPAEPAAGSRPGVATQAVDAAPALTTLVTGGDASDVQHPAGIPVTAPGPTPEAGSRGAPEDTPGSAPILPDQSAGAVQLTRPTPVRADPVRPDPTVAGPAGAAVASTAVPITAGGGSGAGPGSSGQGSPDRRKDEISSISTKEIAPAGTYPLTATVTPTAATSATSAPATPPALSRPVAPNELAAPLIRLRSRGDGDHELTIALHPADLGPVSVHVRLTGTDMAIQLASSNDGAHAALREALPQLRTELQNAGLSSHIDLSLDVNSQSASADSQRQNRNERPEPVSYPAELPKKHTESRSISRSRGLDRWL